MGGGWVEKVLATREVGEESEGERGHGVAPAGVLRSPSFATPPESRQLPEEKVLTLSSFSRVG